MMTCKNCGAKNNNDARFCRSCGIDLSNAINHSLNTPWHMQPIWYIFIKGLSLIMIIYGLFAVVTLHSRVSFISDNGRLVWTEHSDAFGLIRSYGSSLSIDKNTSIDIIIDDSMMEGRQKFYFFCFIIILAGCLIGGISMFIYRRRKNKNR